MTDDAHSLAERPEGMMQICERCNGGGSIMVAHTVPRCCERSRTECGGRGCTGPEPDEDWQQEMCPDCYGAGHIAAPEATAGETEA